MRVFRVDLGGQRTEHVGRRRRLRVRAHNDRRTGRYWRLRGPTKVWQGPGHFQRVHSGSSGKDPNALRKVTSESVDNSCIKASVVGH